MSIAHHTLLAAPSLGSGWIARVTVVVAGLVAEWRVHRDLRQLQELDSAALHDIGLAPGGLEGAVRYGRRARPGSEPARAPAPASLPVSLTEWR